MCVIKLENLIAFFTWSLSSFCLQNDKNAFSNKHLLQKSSIQLWDTCSVNDSHFCILSNTFSRISAADTAKQLIF